MLSVSTAERKGKRTLVLCDVFSVQSLSATEWMDLKAPCFLHTPPNPLPQQNQWDNVVHYSGGQCKKKNSYQAEHPSSISCMGGYKLTPSTIAVFLLQPPLPCPTSTFHHILQLKRTTDWHLHHTVTGPLPTQTPSSNFSVTNLLLPASHSEPSETAVSVLDSD